MHNNIIIHSAAEADHEEIARIYNHYVLNTTATFEEHKVSPEGMSARINEVMGSNLPWLVLNHNDRVMGYAYATKWKDRSAYRYTVESSIYIEPGQTEQGMGSMLYSELFRILQNNGIHVVMGGITLPNEASVAFHEKFGMEKVAHFKQVGYKFGRWVDIGYWQRILSS